MQLKHKFRLLLLAHLLQYQSFYQPDVVEFDINTWQDKSRSCNLNGKCGTAACAVGAAMLWAPFNWMGLVEKDFAPAYKGYAGWDAVVKFFGFPGHYSWMNADANHLFEGSSYYGTPKEDVRAEVIRRIRHYVKTGGKQ